MPGATRPLDNGARRPPSAAPAPPSVHKIANRPPMNRPPDASFLVRKSVGVRTTSRYLTTDRGNLIISFRFPEARLERRRWTLQPLNLEIREKLSGYSKKMTRRRRLRRFISATTKLPLKGGLTKKNAGRKQGPFLYKLV